MENTFYTGDDCLVIQSVKTSTTGNNRQVAKLHGDYKKAMNRGDVYTYWDKETDHKVSASNATLEQKEFYIPCYAYNQNLDNGNTVNVQGNKCEVRLLRLLNKPKDSRYKLTVDMLVELVDREILSYTQRADTLTLKNRREAMRNRGLRDWKVSRYEHNIFFKGEIARSILKSLKDSELIDSRDKEENTVYLRTDREKRANDKREKEGKKRNKSTVKFYDMLPKHGVDACKLEIIIDSSKIRNSMRAWEKDHSKENLSLISTWLDHPKIQELFKVYKVLKCGITLLLDSVSADCLREVQEMVQETNADRIADKLLDPFYTLKEVINRVENLEKRQERQERTQGAILKHIGMDSTKLNKD